jgi:hypothetical protein
MSEPSVSALAIYQLRVVLCGVSPLVWRRLLVVNETSLGELHEILQNAFDWSGEHLHSFFAFALLPFYLLEQQRSGLKFYSCAFVSIVLLISCSVTTAFGTLSCIKNVVFPQTSNPATDCGMRCPGVTVKAHDSISSEPRSDVARSPTSKPRR